ncbi:MAG: aldehyde dehydrogenase family protein [Opitutaceae bacterium]
MSQPILTSSIDGVWQQPGRRVHERRNPGRTDRIAARWSPATRSQARRAMDGAARAAAHWSSKGPKTRLGLLREFLKRLEGQAGPLARMITRENGKTLEESGAEIRAALADGRYLLDQVRNDLLRSPGSSGNPKKALIHEPVGVTLLITPWNFPLATIVRKILPALAFGNTVVLKPSELTPGPAVGLVRILQSIPFPPGVIHLVLGTGAGVGPTLTGHPALRLISFTGSNRVGLRLAEQTAGRDVRLQLEMGGKNSLVVLADADLDAAVEAALTGGFSCAGQWCTGTGRVIVERSVYELFCDNLGRAVRALRTGPGDLKSTRVGPVISAQRVRFARRSIREAVAAGARLVCGGAAPLPTTRGRSGNYVTPTVLADVLETMAVFHEELFVPVLPVTPAKDEADAFRLANLGRFGLSASVFTSSPKKAGRFIRGVEAGIVHHNLHTAFRTSDLPVSAWRDSGRGIPECGHYSASFFARPRAVYLND